VAKRDAEEDALLEAAFEGEARPAELAPESGAGRSRTRRAKLLKAAADKVKARPQDAVSLLDLRSSRLPARLGKLAGREGWWFAYKFTIDALVSEERVIHLVLWHDGEQFHALPLDEADEFAALPADEARGGPRGATVSIGATQEEALATIHTQLLGSVQERSGAAFDESRERWDRSVEDTLLTARAGVETARQAWQRARGALHDKGDLPLRDRRGLLERAEREYRRKLDELRATEAQRYAERDRSVAELKRKAEPKERRTLVATAYWRCI